MTCTRICSTSLDTDGFKNMIITELENLVGKNVELLISGHFFTGNVISTDAASDTIQLKEDDGSVSIIDASAIALLKVQS